MPVLSNAKHERFAQGLATGLSASEAYEEAGFKPSRSNASVLKSQQNIVDRVDELLERRETVERRALEKAIETLALTKERVLAELAKIGFSDIRKLLKWQGNAVTIIDSDELDNDTAGAIAEVSQTPHGLKVKMYDKKGALVDLGKHLGMFKDQAEVALAVNVTISGQDAKLL